MRGGGRDVMTGGLDNDILCGGPQGDTMRGSKGDDAMFGQAGKDRISAGQGDDFLVGGKDADQRPGRRRHTRFSRWPAERPGARAGGTDACTTDPGDTVDGCEA